MKPTTLITAALIGTLSQMAPAASQRSCCADQALQIKALEKEIDAMHALLAKNNIAPVKKRIAVAVPKGGSSTYKIQKGDSLSKVARRNGITLGSLLNANKGINANHLNVGQVIKLPASAAKAQVVKETQPRVAEVLPAPIKPSQPKAKPAKAAASSSDYVVQNGDTLYHIARTNNVTVASILELNKGLTPSKLRPGQHLKLNGGKTSKPASKKAVASAPKKKTTPKAVAKKLPAQKPAAVAKKAPAASTKKMEVKQVSSTPKQAKVRTVSVTRQMTFGDFASTYGASVDQINEMNGLKLTKSTVLAQGSELYIPNNQL